MLVKHKTARVSRIQRKPEQNGVNRKYQWKMPDEAIM